MEVEEGPRGTNGNGKNTIKKQNKTRHWPIHRQRGENPQREPTADAKPVSAQ